MFPGIIPTHSGFPGNDPKTILLLPFDGADAATTTTDKSATGATITLSGAVLDDAQVRFGNTSLLLDGVNDYATVGANAAWNFGTGDFTLDHLVRVSAFSVTANYFFDMRPGGGPLLVGYSTSVGTLQFFCGGGVATSAAGVITTNIWYHIAFVRASGTLTVYLDGTSVATASGGSSMDASGSTWNIGAEVNLTAGQFHGGWLDHFRICNVARWTADFTPPNRPYI